MKNKEINKIIITGGGTGGHLIPSFAIADALKRKQTNIDIRFIGSSMGIESKLYKNRDEKYYSFSDWNFKFKKDNSQKDINFLKSFKQEYSSKMIKNTLTIKADE